MVVGLLTQLCACRHVPSWRSVQMSDRIKPGHDGCACTISSHMCA